MNQDTAHTPLPEEPVLATLNVDGSRRWIRPKLSRGRFLRARFAAAWTLIAIFAAMPYFQMNGKPLVLLDIVNRRFTFFGSTFLATDTVLLALLLISIITGIFLLTAMLGRVWCGWACPQTVYMEFVFRPLERLLEGSRRKQLELDEKGPNLRRILKFPIFLMLSFLVAHIFLSYFVGIEALSRWVRSSPFEHPTAFFVMAFTTGLMFFDFAYFREQTCLVACPYGRLQSVLFDRQTLIVGYDQKRGEPRGKLAKRAQKEGEPSRGDCIDCKLCVTTCPTGIDIRKGLQMECIGCTQCIDACDAVMDKIGKSRGLIRYTSSSDLAGEPRHLLRLRVVLYPLIMVSALTLLTIALSTKSDTDVSVLRATGSPFAVLPDGNVSNSLRIKIANRTDRVRSYTVELADLPEGNVLSAEIPLQIPGGKHDTVDAFVVVPPSVFVEGRRKITLRITDGEGQEILKAYLLLGPASTPPEGGR